MKPVYFVIAALTLTACDEPKREVTLDDVKEKAVETLDTAKQLVTQEQSRALDRLKVRLDAIDAKIKALEEKASDTKGEAKDRLSAQIDKLEEQREALQDKIDELKDKGGDAWEAARGGLDEAMTDLEDAYDDAKAALE